MNEPAPTLNYWPLVITIEDVHIAELAQVVLDTVSDIHINTVAAILAVMSYQASLDVDKQRN